MIILYGLLLLVYTIGFFPFFAMLDLDNGKKTFISCIGMACWMIMFPAIVLQCIGVF